MGWHLEPVRVAVFLVTLACGTAIAYSFMLALTSLTVWMVRNQSLMEMWWLFSSLARYPKEIFMGTWAEPMGVFFTFILPILLVVNVPAIAQDKGKTYNVVILGSIGVNPGYILVNNKDYPQIADDYVRGFKVLRALPCDVFLASHSRFYGMPEKYAKLKDGGPNPFIDPAGYRAHLDLQEKNFKEKLAEQQKAAK